LENPENCDKLKVLKQTVFLSIIITRKAHEWIERLFKIGTTSSMFPEVWAVLKERGLPQKTVLLLASSFSYPREHELTSDCDFMTVKLLSPIVATVIQLMDQGVIASVK
jgi:hypothetical protein